MKCPSCGSNLPQPEKNSRCPDCGARLDGKGKDEASPKRKQTQIEKPHVFSIWLLIGAIWFLFGAIMLVSFVPKLVDYWSGGKDRIVEVEAVISNLTIERDSDDNWNGNAFVDYSYGGKSYRNVKIRAYTSDMRLGGTVTIRIDPEEPGVEFFEPTVMGLILIVPTVAGGLMLWFWLVKPWLEYFRKKQGEQELR